MHSVVINIIISPQEKIFSLQYHPQIPPGQAWEFERAESEHAKDYNFLSMLYRVC